jgi:two-component system CheB/CheR fusion protein
LWLVRNIVTLHGGSIHAESDGRDRGATFRVSLPLYRR